MSLSENGVRPGSRRNRPENAVAFRQTRAAGSDTIFCDALQACASRPQESVSPEAVLSTARFRGIQYALSERFGIGAPAMNPARKVEDA